MKKHLSAMALAAAALLGASPAQAAPVVTFTSVDPNIETIGGSATVSMRISGLDSEILSAFDLNWVWNSATLFVQSGDVSAGCAALGTSDFCGFDIIAQVNLGAKANSTQTDAFLQANQANDFEIASFTFTGLADGATFFTLGSNLESERKFAGLGARSLPVNVGGICITVGTGTGCNAVPEPTSLALLGLALAGAFAPGALRRRREPVAAAPSPARP